MGVFIVFIIMRSKNKVFIFLIIYIKVCIVIYEFLYFMNIINKCIFFLNYWLVILIKIFYLYGLLILF